MVKYNKAQYCDLICVNQFYGKDDKFAAGGDSLTLADICLLATYTTLKVSV